MGSNSTFGIDKGKGQGTHKLLDIGQNVGCAINSEICKADICSQPTSNIFKHIHKQEKLSSIQSKVSFEC